MMADTHSISPLTHTLTPPSSQCMEMLDKTQYKIIKYIIEFEGKKRKSSGAQNEEI